LQADSCLHGAESCGPVHATGAISELHPRAQSCWNPEDTQGSQAVFLLSFPRPVRTPANVPKRSANVPVAGARTGKCPEAVPDTADPADRGPAGLAVPADPRAMLVPPDPVLPPAVLADTPAGEHHGLEHWLWPVCQPHKVQHPWVEALMHRGHGRQLQEKRHDDVILRGARQLCHQGTDEDELVLMLRVFRGARRWPPTYVNHSNPNHLPLENDTRTRKHGPSELSAATRSCWVRAQSADGSSRKR